MALRRWVTVTALSGVVAATAAGALLAVACGSDDTGATSTDAGSDATIDGSEPDALVEAGPSLSIALHRVTDAGAPNPVHAVVRIADANDAGIAGATVTLVAGDASVPVTDDGDGNYESTVTPPFVRGELPFVASTTSGLRASVTAVVLDTVSDAWDQPEMVGGLVNTPGTEDSSTVSPDGEWLIVGTYLPVDYLCCAAASAGNPCDDGPADGRNASCVDVIGPVSAPARPGMPGTDRIVGGRVIENAPRLCVVNPDGGDYTIPLADGGTFVPAVSLDTAYGFHRQADGTFAEPFTIHFDDDGFGGGPFCFTFRSAPSSGKADVIFAYRRDDDFNGPHRPARTTLTMGRENVLGTYFCDAGGVDYVPGPIAELPVSPATQNAGNTSEGAGYLWSDDESVNPAVPLVAAEFVDGGIAPWSPLALPSAGQDRRQPVLYDGKIYYFDDLTVTSAAWDGGAPSAAGSFGPAVVELGGLPAGSPTVTPGDIVALGQPTFAKRPDGSIEMVFVYYKKTPTGFDGQIGIVRSR